MAPQAAEAAENIRVYGSWLIGRWSTDGDVQPGASVIDPFSGARLADQRYLSKEAMDQAIEASVRAFAHWSRSSRAIRYRLLSRLAEAVRSLEAEFTSRIVQEAGKPLTLARAEVQRGIITLTWSAEEAKRIGGEVIPIDGDAVSRGYGPVISGLFPRGPVLGISPFNFPLNLALHKVGPALASGSSVMLKPPPQAPGAMLLFAEVFEQVARELNAELEKGQGAWDSRDRIPLDLLQVVLASNEVVARAVQDPRIPTLSFTGSDRVGWMLRDQARRKRVLLELGGNAHAIVHEDADLLRAAKRCAWGAFTYAGQVCISVQKILVHELVFRRFESLFIGEARHLSVGDPSRADTVVGPLIDDGAAQRIQDWTAEARARGAKVLLEGERRGRVIGPTVLTNVPEDVRVSCDEAFGPVVILESYRDLDEAIARSNASRFGLQAGIFTSDLGTARRAFEELEVGGVIVNDVPTFRADPMPYGGAKDSGLGREGIRSAISEFCDPKVRVDWTG